jgi:hypothetical protein
MNDELRRRLLDSPNIPEETKRRLAGAGVPVHEGQLGTTSMPAERSKIAEPRQRTNAELVEESARARPKSERSSRPKNAKRRNSKPIRRRSRTFSSASTWRMCRRTRSGA